MRGCPHHSHFVFKLREMLTMFHAALLIQHDNRFGAGGFASAGAHFFNWDAVINGVENRGDQVSALINFR